MDISNLGKGAIQTPEIIARSRFMIAEEPLRAIYWPTPFVTENGFTLVQKNQDGSSSCTAQATTYYCEALNKIENNKFEQYSARFNYSQSYLPGGGSYIWKAMSIPLTVGTASAASVPDGTASESIMIDGSLNSVAQIEARTDKYAQIPNNRNIDYLAQIIQDYHGFVTGFNGRNDMFSPDGTANLFTSSVQWGHAVYVCGYEMRNGQKCLRFKNSWSANWGSNGYGFFTEQFVKEGPLFDAYVYAEVTDLSPSSISMTEEQLNNLWLAVFKRPIDSAGLAFYKGKSFDTVIRDILNSPEHLYYAPVFSSVKKIEEDVRNGIF